VILVICLNFQKQTFIPCDDYLNILSGDGTDQRVQSLMFMMMMNCLKSVYKWRQTITNSTKIENTAFREIYVLSWTTTYTVALRYKLWYLYSNVNIFLTWQKIMDADDETKNIRTGLCSTLLKTSDILKPKD